MSSLSNHPFPKILGYWHRNLSGMSYTPLFLLVKAVEILAFRNGQGHAGAGRKMEHYARYRGTNDVPEKPTISVVVPAYVKNKNDISNIQRLSEQLLAQTYQANVIVVDDNSPMDFQLAGNIKIIRLSKNHGPAKARNIGIKRALSSGTEVILLTDIDCVPSLNWIEQMVQGFQRDRECHILSGKTYSWDKTWLGTYHDINGTLNGRRFKDSDQLLYGPTCNLALTRRVAEEITFDTEFPYAAGEDIEFCFRALAKGFNIKHCQDAIMFHDFGYHRYGLISNLIKFIFMFKKYTKGERILLQKIPEYYSYLDATIEIGDKGTSNKKPSSVYYYSDAHK